VTRRGGAGAALALSVVFGAALLIRAQDELRSGEWRSSGGDSTYKRYSPLAQITRTNVKNLRVVWRHAALDPDLKARFPKLRTNNYLRATPTMIGGVLYAPDLAGLIQAIDAATGQLLWRQEPPPEIADEATASSTRGVDVWKGGASDYRLLTVRNGYLYALDLRGKPASGFGDNGRVNLLPAGAHRFNWSSGPIVVGSVAVIAGNLDGAGDEGWKWKAVHRKTSADSMCAPAGCCGPSMSCRATASTVRRAGATGREACREISDRGAAFRRTSRSATFTFH
jgi:quinoprotein glucose dehydrogenase